MYKAEDLEIFIMTCERQDLLKETLRCFQNQTLQGFSMILLDNSKDEKDKNFFEQFNDLNLKYIHNKKNLGPEGNTWKAYELASKKLLMMFHDDDYINSDFVKIVIDAFNSHNIDALVGGDVEFLTSDMDYNFKKIKKYYRLSSRKQYALFEFWGLNSNFASFVYKTELFKKLDIYRFQMFGKGGDRPLMISSVPEDGKIIVLDENCVKYRQHQGQDMKNTSRGPFEKDILNLASFYYDELYNQKNFIYKIAYSIGFIPYLSFCFKWMQSCNNRICFDEIFEHSQEKKFVPKPIYFLYKIFGYKILLFFFREIRNFLRQVFFTRMSFNKKRLFFFKREKYRTFINFLGIKLNFKNKVKKEDFVLEEYLWLYRDKFIDKNDYDEKIEKFESFGLNVDKKRPRKVVVSLTSFKQRLYEIQYCLYSLLNQTFKPDELVLYLSETEFPGKENDLDENVLCFKKNGLKIKFCPDLKSYKKLYFALKDYPDDIIVTCDDDCYYPSNWLKNLYETHLEDEKVICANSVKKIKKILNNVLPYEMWAKQKDPGIKSYSNFLVGEGGVLYPPRSLDAQVFDVETFQRLCPYGDDIWFWAMAVKKGTKIRLAKNSVSPKYINMARELGLIDEMTLFRTFNKSRGNDIQLKETISELSLKKML